MFKRLTNLFRPSATKDCGNPDCVKMMESLHLIIDGEVTPEEKEYFRKHLDDCQPCFDHYNVEKSLLESIRTKINKKSCPEQVILNIKDQIKKEQISTQ